MTFATERKDTSLVHIGLLPRPFKQRLFTIVAIVLLMSLTILYVCDNTITFLENRYDQKAHFELVLRVYCIYIFVLTIFSLLFFLYVRPIADVRIRLLLNLLIVELVIFIGVMILDDRSIKFMSEKSSLTFFSSLFLVLTGLAAFVNFYITRHVLHLKNITQAFWFLLACAFFFAGVDDYFMLHEKFSSSISHKNWVNDLSTAIYLFGALIFISIFSKVLKETTKTRATLFTKMFILGVVLFAFTVLLDSFDYVFTVFSAYIDPLHILGTVEEILEFTASTLFLASFLVYAMEVDGASIKRHVSRDYHPNKYLCAAITSAFFLTVTVPVAFSFFNDDRSPPIIYEDSFEVTVFADAEDGLNKADGLIFSPQYGLLLANRGDSSVIAFDRDGESKVLINGGSGLVSPEGMVVIGDTLFIADDRRGQVLEFSSQGEMVVFASEGLRSPEGLAVDSQSRIYLADEKLSTIFIFTEEGPRVLASSVDGIMSPEEMTFDDDDNLYVADEAAAKVFKIDQAGNTQVFLDGNDGLVSPEAIVYSNGNIFVADSSTGTIYKFDMQRRGGRLVTFSRNYRELSGVALDDRGDLFVATTDNYKPNNYIFKISNVK